MGGIYIPNIKKPEICDYCFLPLTKCEYFSDLKLERCPLIEIVTCGECKHREENHYCVKWGQPYLCNDEAFCSYGERKDFDGEKP